MSQGVWSPPGWARRLSWALPVLAVAYGLTLLPGVRGPHPVFVPWLEIGVGDGILVASGLLCVARAVLVPRGRLAWALIGTAPLVYALGDLVYYAFLQDLADPPYPSWSDVAWLACTRSSTSGWSCWSARPCGECGRACGSTGWPGGSARRQFWARSCCGRCWGDRWLAVDRAHQPGLPRR